MVIKHKSKYRNRQLAGLLSHAVLEMTIMSELMISHPKTAQSLKAPLLRMRKCQSLSKTRMPSTNTGR